MKLVLALLIVLGLLTPSALACSCAPPPPPDEALRESAAVFSGTVTDIKTDGHRKLVTLKVDRTWKGLDADTVTISTAANSAACGYGFAKDKAYLVYANGEAGKLSTNICTRTKTMSEAKDDLAALGEGKPVERK